MKKIKFISILVLCFSLFFNINATLISEGYHFFDTFYYKDMYKDFIKQKKSNKCSIENGPNCFYIKGKNEKELYKDLNNIFHDNDLSVKETPEQIFSKLKASSKLINNKEDEVLDEEVYSFDSPYVMSLQLTFESFDEMTKNGDIYSPETIDTPYDIGRITLTIVGRLRLSQKNSEQFEIPGEIRMKMERPKGTYAFVESKEVFVKFNSKSTFVSVYIKKNSYNKDNKPFLLYGYKNGKRKLITKVQNVPSNQWIKISGDGKKYDSIGLIRGFDFDNFVIYGSVNAENSDDLNKLNKKYSSSLNEKINGAIRNALSQINAKDFKSNGKTGNVHVVKIDLNQNDLIQDDEEDTIFDIPEELLAELTEEENRNDPQKEKNTNEKDSNENNNKQDL
jgi:hypothetical protein